MRAFKRSLSRGPAMVAVIFPSRPTALAILRKMGPCPCWQLFDCVAHLVDQHFDHALFVVECRRDKHFVRGIGAARGREALSDAAVLAARRKGALCRPAAQTLGCAAAVDSLSHGR